uniref:non-specific serine/threonine protein kinase n=1 Tax=Oryza punctata TaxID=4537 RepID=A0A0E0L0A2_ORYPU
MRRRSSSCLGGHLLWLVLVLWSWRIAAAQAQHAPKTDPIEELQNLSYLQDLNLNHNYLTGAIPSFIGKFAFMKYLGLGFNPLSGSLPKELGNLTNLLSLGVSLDNFTGELPEELGNLTKLEQLKASDNEFTGKLPDYLGSLTKLEDLDLSFNNITGQVPQSILNLGRLQFLFLGNNSFTGSLPDVISSSLKAMNLVANNFVLGSTKNSVPPGLNCLQQDTPCFRGSPKYYSFAVDCGSDISTRGSDNTIYEADATNLGDASYYVTDQIRWGVSNNAVNSKLFETARMSPSSLRYYGLGLENGNYTVMLQFAEFAFPDTQTWLSLGRRVFDIYVQGALKEKNFDIRKTAGGKSFTAINRTYTATVLKNFLEIHLFWAGKGTSGIPTQGYYGPMISALSVTPSKQSCYVDFKILLQLCEMVYQKREAKQGKLPDGRVIAVKQLSESSHQGKSQFVTEVATISAVQHRNLVKLHGCCIDSNTPLLVYEYLENGSLDRAIFGDSSLNLDWAMRFEIILGIARGLSYLHEESSVCIVHRDIKASNILLDTDLTPKISDFGLAKLYDEKQTHVSTRIAGTFGYLAPEYAMRGHLTQKTDVFAFGVVMLETVAGRSNTNNSLEESKVYLLEWAWDQYEKEQALRILDPSLNGFNKDEAFRVIRVALHCTQGSPHQRPPMSKVVAMLTGEVEVPEVVTKPSYITEWQMMDGNRSYVTSSYSGSTTHEFSRQNEIEPLQQSPPIIKAER